MILFKSARLFLLKKMKTSSVTCFAFSALHLSHGYLSGKQKLQRMFEDTKILILKVFLCLQKVVLDAGAGNILPSLLSV